MKITGNEPVYPVVNADGFCTSLDNVQGLEAGAVGLTIRQHFAVMAVQGYCVHLDWSIEDTVKAAVVTADALIIELNKSEK